MYNNCESKNHKFVSDKGNNFIQMLMKKGALCVYVWLLEYTCASKVCVENAMKLCDRHSIFMSGKWHVSYKSEAKEEIKKDGRF